jgi:tripartite-type tricarboxylate transporter receptor subunit TctC
MLTSAVAGDTPVIFSSLPSALPFIKEGKLRPVVVLSRNRSESLPNVPGTAEAGVEGLEGDTVSGILAPAGTPRHVIDLLNAEIKKAAALPDMKEKLLGVGFGVVASSPDEFKTRIANEISRWKGVIVQSKIRID